MIKLKNNKGVTLIALVVTIVLLLIIAGVTLGGSIIGIEKTKESSLVTELNMVSHAILERYTKSQLTKQELPGNNITLAEVQNIVNDIEAQTGDEIILKGSEGDYKVLDQETLKTLGIDQAKDEYIVNYKAGEVINKTQKMTSDGKALYVSSM